MLSQIASSIARGALGHVLRNLVTVIPYFYNILPAFGYNKPQLNSGNQEFDNVDRDSFFPKNSLKDIIEGLSSFSDENIDVAIDKLKDYALQNSLEDFKRSFLENFSLNGFLENDKLVFDNTLSDFYNFLKDSSSDLLKPKLQDFFSPKKDNKESLIDNLYKKIQETEGETIQTNSKIKNLQKIAKKYYEDNEASKFFSVIITLSIISVIACCISCEGQIRSFRNGNRIDSEFENVDNSEVLSQFNDGSFQNSLNRLINSSESRSPSQNGGSSRSLLSSNQGSRGQLFADSSRSLGPILEENLEGEGFNISDRSLLNPNDHSTLLRTNYPAIPNTSPVSLDGATNFTQNNLFNSRRASR